MRFTPSHGFVGDPVPFYHSGQYHLFYLRRVTEDSGAEGCAWGHAVSRDLLAWEELPDAFAPGGPDEPDCGACWTGSVIEKDGRFHAFYTGHAPGHPTRPQTVCRATSADLVFWEKDPANPILLPDPQWYESSDWRDPFVFWNEAEGCYWMVLTTRARQPAAAPRRGCLALATSPDLERWEVQPPLWAPLSVHAPECPDLWEQRDRWRLLFSNGTTQLRSAEGLRGPWQPALDPDTDGRWLYAAKCFHAEYRHLLVGWIASRKGNQDAGERQWGGDISLPREAWAAGPGDEIGWKVPDEIQNAWSVPLPDLMVTPLCGKWRRLPTGPRVQAGDGFALSVARVVPASYRLETFVYMAFDQDEAAFRRTTAGFILRLDEAGESGYVVALEPARQQVVLRKWQRWGDPEPMAVQRMHLQRGRPVHVDLYLDGTLLEVFLDDRVVLSGRCYDHTEGGLGFWAQDGNVVFSNPWLYARP